MRAGIGPLPQRCCCCCCCPPVGRGDRNTHWHTRPSAAPLTTNSHTVGQLHVRNTIRETQGGGGGGGGGAAPPVSWDAGAGVLLTAGVSCRAEVDSWTGQGDAERTSVISRKGTSSPTRSSGSSCTRTGTDNNLKKHKTSQQCWTSSSRVLRKVWISCGADLPTGRETPRDCSRYKLRPGGHTWPVKLVNPACQTYFIAKLKLLFQLTK